MAPSLRANAASFVIALSLLFAVYCIGQAYASPQPRLQAALAHLRAARGSLEKGVPDRSGHRLRALSMVNQAIEEVMLGLRDGK